MYKLNSIIYDKVIHLLYWKPYLLVRFMINLSQLIEIAAILNANFSNLRYKNIWNNNFLHELIFFIHIFIFDCSINHIIEFTKLMIFFSFFLTSYSLLTVTSARQRLVYYIANVHRFPMLNRAIVSRVLCLLYDLSSLLRFRTLLGGDAFLHSRNCAFAFTMRQSRYFRLDNRLLSD